MVMFGCARRFKEELMLGFWKAIHRFRTSTVNGDPGAVDAIVRLFKGEGEGKTGRRQDLWSDDTSYISDRAACGKLRGRRTDRGDVRHG